MKRKYILFLFMVTCIDFSCYAVGSPEMEGVCAQANMLSEVMSQRDQLAVRVEELMVAFRKWGDSETSHPQQGAALGSQGVSAGLPGIMLPGQAAIFGMTSRPRATCLHVEVQTDAQLQNEKDENETLRAQFAANATALTELQAACAADHRGAEIAALQAKLRDADDRARMGEKHLRELQAEARRFASSEEAIARLGRERDALNKRVPELEMLLLQAKERIGRLEPLSAEVSSLNSALRQSTTENEDAQRADQLRDSEIRRLKAENTRVKDAAAAAKRTHDRLTDTIQRERSAAQTREASLTDKIRRLEGELAAALRQNAAPSRGTHSGVRQSAVRRDDYVPQYKAPAAKPLVPTDTQQRTQPAAKPALPATQPAAAFYTKASAQAHFNF